MALSEPPQQGSGGARGSNMGWQIILLLHETASRTKPAPRPMTCFQVNGGAGIIVDSVGPQRDAEFKVALMLRDRAGSADFRPSETLRLSSLHVNKYVKVIMLSAAK
jgi:hypothetical protein